MIRSILLIAFSLLNILSFNACEDPDPQMDEPKEYGTGLFIVNEGPFVAGSGTITHVDGTSGAVTQAIYQEANDGMALGNIAQSMTFIGEQALVVVNNANLIRVLDAENFQLERSVEGLELPRYVLPISSGKAYVSQWGATGVDGSIAVLNLTSWEIEQTFQTGSGTENMLQVDGLIYAVNGGGFGRDSLLLGIDPLSNTIVTETSVGDNPGSLLADGSGNIWTIGRGHTENFYDPMDPLNTPGMLCRVEPGVDKECLEVPSGSANLVMSADGSMLYFTAAGQIWQYATDGSMAQPQNFFNGSYYTLYWEEATNELLAADAGDFSSPGKVVRIDANGNAVEEITTGVAPTCIVKK